MLQTELRADFLERIVRAFRDFTVFIFLQENIADKQEFYFKWRPLFQMKIITTGAKLNSFSKNFHREASNFCRYLFFHQPTIEST